MEITICAVGCKVSRDYTCHYEWFSGGHLYPLTLLVVLYSHESIHVKFSDWSPSPNSSPEEGWVWMVFATVLRLVCLSYLRCVPSGMDQHHWFNRHIFLCTLYSIPINMTVCQQRYCSCVYWLLDVINCIKIFLFLFFVITLCTLWIMMIIKTRFKPTGLPDPIPGPILFCGTNFALFDRLQHG